jgi:hypothetical protein
MGKDSLDKHIRDQLYSHKTPTDPELIWQKVQAAKGGTTRKPPFYYWLIPIVFIGVLSAGYFMSADRIDDSQKTGSAVLTENFVNKSEIIYSNITSDQEKEIESIDQSKQNTSVTINKTKTNVINKNLANTTVVKKNTSLNKSSKTEISKILSFQNEDNTLIKDLKAIEENKGNEFQSTSNKEDDVRASINTLGAHMSSSNLTTIKLQLDRLSNLESLTPQLPKLNLEIPQLNLLSPAFRPYNRNSSWDFSLGVYGSYGLTDKKMSASGIDSIGYLSARKRTESSLEAIGLGVDIKASKWDNFYIKTGLAYNQINERFDLLDSRDSTYVDDNVLIRITVNANGDSIPEYGPGLVTETYFFQKRIHNSYIFIDFPVSFGFEYQTEDLGYFIEAGASMNLLFSQRGEIFDSSQLPYSINDDSQSYFKSNAGISLIGGFGLSYRISDFMSISAQTNLRYQLSSLNTSNNPIDQKYVIIGLQAGMRFHLGQ